MSATSFCGGWLQALQRLNQQASRASALIYGAVLLITAAVLAISITVWHMRGEALSAAFGNTGNLAIVLAEQTDRSVQAIDIVLRDIQDDVAGDLRLATEDDFKRLLATEPIFRSLHSRAERLPQVDNISLIAADGVRVSYSIAWPAPPTELSDRDYMRHFQAQNDAGLFISQPVVSRATHVWSVFAVRRINGKDGRFLGVILAAIPLQVFTSLFSSITLPDSETFMLLRRDGTVLVRYPDAPSHIGGRMPEKSLWYSLVAAGGGKYQSPGYFDEQSRLVAVQPLAGYPLVLDVGTPTAGALAHWRHLTVLIGLGTAFAASLLLLLVLLLRQQLARLEQSRAALRLRNAELTRVAGALRDSETRLDAKTHALDTTLAAMDQGLMMVDARGTVAVCNARAIDLLDLPPTLIAAPSPFTEIAARHPDDGIFALMHEALECANDPASSLPCAPRCGEHCVTGDRIVEARCVRLPAGGVVATFDDITARRHAEQQVAFMARHDALTRLPNRAAFVERLEATVAQAGRGALAAVLCLDLDHFKEVNDTLGHPIGDRLLRAVADRLTACVRQVDTVARFGGDEFAVVQTDAARAEDVGLFAQRIIEVLSLPFDLSGHQVTVGASIGIALIPADGADPDRLLKSADIALYRAKADGRGVYRFFAPAMDARLQERRQLELDLQHALTHEEFELYYQPLIDLESNNVCAFEALLRWHHPQRGLLEPGAFVPLTEEMGLIVPLGGWALRQACREATTWPDNVAVAVNLSPVQFRHRELVPMVAAALEASKLEPSRLELEITEAVLLQSNEEVMETLHGLRDLGVRIAMDDFGTGYSSLGYLRCFPFDKIKIDQSFVRDLPEGADAAAIVRAVTRMGNSLGMVTTAEGVETGEQLAHLRAEGCVEVQGYLFSRPRPARELPQLLRLLGQHEATVAA
ncbi:MAG TPA: EAL domain-containing protein [Acetobacteraceae bacterium]|nr:EAL domain-containing protein [Acetobacteraceae bacterium]